MHNKVLRLDWVSRNVGIVHCIFNLLYYVI